MANHQSALVKSTIPLTVWYILINTMVKDSYYREMMIICNFKGEILFKSKHLKLEVSVVYYLLAHVLQLIFGLS